MWYAERVLRHREYYNTESTDLDWKADELECFVLTPATDDVREGPVRVLVQRWLMRSHSPVYADHQQRDTQCKDTVHKHQELRVFETFACAFSFAVVVRHNALLQQAPDEIGGEQAASTEAEQDALPSK